MNRLCILKKFFVPGYKLTPYNVSNFVYDSYLNACFPIYLLYPVKPGGGGNYGRLNIKKNCIY